MEEENASDVIKKKRGVMLLYHCIGVSYAKTKRLISIHNLFLHCHVALRFWHKVFHGANLNG